MRVTREVLDKIANDYHLKGEAPDMYIENTCQRYELEWVLEQIGDKSKILDLGYGDGLFFEKLSNGKELTVVEGSSDLAQAAKSRADQLGTKIEVVNSMFEDFNPEVLFDVVVASHVLEHVDDPKQVLKKIKTWLAPEGMLVCIVPNSESLHRRLGLKMGLIGKLDELSARDYVVGHLRVYSYKDLKADLNQAGFEVINKRGFFTKALSNSQMLGLSEEVIRGLCQLSDELPLEMGANIGVVGRMSEHLE